MDYLINSLVPTARTRDGRWSPCRQPSVEAAILRVRKHKRAGRRERVPVGAALSHTQTHTHPHTHTHTFTTLKLVTVPTIHNRATAPRASATGTVGSYTDVGPEVSRGG